MKNLRNEEIEQVKNDCITIEIEIEEKEHEHGPR